MHKGRIEAFSDGVIAIIITIMVLELKVPHEDSWKALSDLLPVFISYFLSFIYVGIYWNNHHHMFQAVRRVSGPALWANLHLLFWLSLIPFTTGWMGENHFSKNGVILYGLNLIGAALAYTVLVRSLLAIHEDDSEFKRAVGSDFKGKISLLIYLVGIGLSFMSPILGLLPYIIVEFIWLIPDKRFEKILDGKSPHDRGHRF